MSQQPTPIGCNKCIGFDANERGMKIKDHKTVQKSTKPGNIEHL